MVDLIQRFRLLVNDAAAATWTDQQAQDLLDQYRVRVYREPLEMEKTLTSATTYEYKVFHSRYRNFEQGTALFKVEDASGGQRGTADYTADYIRGVLTMTADQAGTALYLTAWAYDLDAAAADAWRQQAGNVAAYYNFTADGHQMSRSQWFDHCVRMAEIFDARSQPVTVRQWRVGDLDER